MGPRSYRRGALSTLVLMAPLVGAIAAGPATPAAAAAAAAPTSVAPAATSVVPATPALVQLPARASQGQAATLSTQITHVEPEGTFIWTISVTSQVTAVQGDFSYTTRSIIQSIDETRPDAGSATSPFDSLFSLSFDQAYAANGAFQSGALIDAGNLSVEQQAAGDALLDSMAMATVGFPSEPIAVGASWTSRSTVGSDGIQTAVDIRCRLTSVAADTYTMDVSYSTSAAGQTSDGWVDATVSGSGTFNGSLTNPLVVNGSLNQTVDGILTAADGTSSPWNKDTSILVETTA